MGRRKRESPSEVRRRDRRRRVQKAHSSELGCVMSGDEGLMDHPQLGPVRFRLLSGQQMESIAAEEGEIASEMRAVLGLALLEPRFDMSMVTPETVDALIEIQQTVLVRSREALQ